MAAAFIEGLADLNDEVADLNGRLADLNDEVARYDHDGNVVFESYAMDTAGQAVYTDTTLKGTHTTYDALDRPVSVQQDWEFAGTIETKNEYLTGFKTRTTNPRGFATTTSYLTFDQPTYDWPYLIEHPEGTVTDIGRDWFGKPNYVRRRPASGASITRSFVYDEYARLCKTIEPETSSTIVEYDAANNVAWSASGQALPLTTDCQRSSVPASARVVRAYDQRNRPTSVAFSDGMGDTTYSYWQDGQPKVVAANNANGEVATTTYTYNRRRLLTREQLVFPAINWPIDYSYNTNGHLASQAWHGITVDYAPNALGQPTKAGVWASGVTYHPNGGMKQFTYGNGVVHTMAQNARGLPEYSKDAYGATEFIDDGYDYDANGNVLAITDGKAGRGNRDMTYDGLDRLLSVNSPMFNGTMRYTYDGLDNIETLVAPATVTPAAPARNLRYCNNAKFQLAFVRSDATNCTNGSATTTFEYDDNGNVDVKDNIGYAFDLGNRLRTVTNNPASALIAAYAYDGHGRRVWENSTGDAYFQYTQDGRLAFGTDGGEMKVREYIQLNGSVVAIRERDAITNVYTTRYQHTDALGSPVIESDQNRLAGNVSEYEPYGKSSTPDGMGYTGHVEDAATSLIYMQQRYYDAAVGRFLSVDPVTANPKSGANFNRYWYGNDNPYRFRDPDGRYTCAGSPEQCGALKDALKAVGNAAASFKPGSSEYQTLTKVISFYGAEGEDNGVKITTFTTPGAGGDAGTKGGKTTINVNFENAAKAGKPGSTAYVGSLGATLVHEGVHGWEQKRFGMPSSGQQENWGEKRAMTAQAQFYQGGGGPDNYGLLLPGGRINAENIEYYADQSTGQWLCPQCGE